MSFKIYHGVPLDCYEGKIITNFLNLRKEARTRKDKQGYHALTMAIHGIVKLYKKNHGKENQTRKE